MQLSRARSADAFAPIIADSNARFAPSLLWTVVHPPTTFEYSPEYFATFVTDPDSGVRWEFAHIPVPVPSH